MAVFCKVVPSFLTSWPTPAMVAHDEDEMAASAIAVIVRMFLIMWGK